MEVDGSTPEKERSAVRRRKYRSEYFGIDPYRFSKSALGGTPTFSMCLAMSQERGLVSARSHLLVMRNRESRACSWLYNWIGNMVMSIIARLMKLLSTAVEQAGERRLYLSTSAAYGAGGESR